MSPWASSILDTIGQTPLVRLNRIPAHLPATVLGKVEFFNPGGSIKDRIALGMIEQAERDGTLKPGGTIVEGTSGNTGAGLALVAIARGYRCIFTTTDKQSPEKLDVLRALGAEVIVCPTAVAPDDPRSYYSVARRLASEIPGAVYLNQYDHPANAEAHYTTTGPELWAQTEGRITHLIATAGTGGTISGIARYLKEQNPNVKVIGVDPFGSVYYSYFHTGVFDEKEIYPYVTEGVGEDILAGNMDFAIVDDYVRVEDGEAMRMTRRLAREEGLFVGQSCGMAMAGAMQWLEANAATLRPDDVVVVMLPDSGFRYLSKTYNDAWMERHGYLKRGPELSLQRIVKRRKETHALVFAHPAYSINEAVALMQAHGISQVPVFDGDTQVGSLNERDLMTRLLTDPHARERRVEEVMGDPFPIVPDSLPLDKLSALLQNAPGAVLVANGATPRAYQVVTRSDVLYALAHDGLPA